ncbi:GUN4 domain-containing protein [Pseudanabaenaceae cyanobacterium LEGE 13415]|nr:GUN4 domain-containing protein [Pseudanabaenaceae cyanobacterium LEGE 13415]
MIGQVLDRRYRVTTALGGGGFSQTYIGEDIRRPGNPKCVIKHLYLDRFTGEQLDTAKRLFNSEAETLEKLGQHPQIPQLFAYLDEEFCLVQEFIEGQSLQAELQSDTQWTEEKVIQLLTDVLETLVYVHQQNVIHRDIKPDNLIRRASDGKLVLIDFGAVKQLPQAIATSVATQAEINRTITIGTLGYYPTEQGQGRPRPSSDLYALGMIAIQALTGVHPRELEEDLETGEILWQNRVSVSPKLETVLTTLVRYHFKDRYSTASEALQAVQALSQPQAKRKPWMIWGSAIALPVIAIAAFSIFRPSDPAVSDRSISTPSISASPSPYATLPNQLQEIYNQLQAELSQQNFKAADETTYKLMIDIAGQRSSRQKGFNLDEWREFPCEWLTRIDQLWRDATNGQQGFRVQSNLYQTKASRNNQQLYKLVGWIDQSGKPRQPNYQAPQPGSLPFKLAWQDRLEHRFDKFAACRF